MTLLQYVQSLQDQGATDIAAKVEEWKKKNQPKVEVEEVKEVKPSKFNKDGSLNVDSFSEETRGAAEKVKDRSCSNNGCKCSSYTSNCTRHGFYIGQWFFGIIRKKRSI